MSESQRPWLVVFHPQTFEPLLNSLDQVSDAPGQDAVVSAALAAADGIAAGRLTGKELGDRRVSGDLTGLLRVRFDVYPAPVINKRFRIVYAITDRNDDAPAPVVRIISIGPRAGHVVYQGAIQNLTDRP